MIYHGQHSPAPYGTGRRPVHLCAGRFFVTPGDCNVIEPLTDILWQQKSGDYGLYVWLVDEHGHLGSSHAIYDQLSSDWDVSGITSY